MNKFDKIINNGTSDMIWAMGTTPKLSYHGTTKG